MKKVFVYLIFVLILFTVIFLIFPNFLIAQSEDYRLPFVGDTTYDTSSRYHTSEAANAIDFQLSYGQKIFATNGGTVIFAEYDKDEGSGSYGYLIIIEHSDGDRSYYAHLTENLEVSVGDEVKQGDLIGYAGNTGTVITNNPNQPHPGTHLHFHIIDKNGNPVNISEIEGIHTNNTATGSSIQVNDVEQVSTPEETQSWFGNFINNIKDKLNDAVDIISDFLNIGIYGKEPLEVYFPVAKVNQTTTETTSSIPPPGKPSLTSPYNWYQSLGTPPLLMWNGDNNSTSYYVIVNSSNTGNVESGWINSTSWKPNLPNENYIYSWKVKAKNRQGVEGPWSDESHFSITSTTLQFEGDISFSPPSPSSAEKIKIFASTTGWGGVGVTLRVSVNTAPDGSSNGEWKILKELGVPKFNEVDAPEWNTKGLSNGIYRIRVEAKGPGDPHWQNPAIIEATYTLVNKAEEQAEAKSVQKEGFSSCIILDEEYCNKGELIYYPGDYGIGFIGLGFTLPEGTKIYSPFKGLAEENVGIIVFGGSGLYGFDILDASDPEWGWKHQRDYLFVGGGVRTIIEIKPMFTENPVEKGQAIAEVTKNQKIITPNGKEYDIAITFMHYDGDSNIWSYNEELLNKYFHYR